MIEIPDGLRALCAHRRFVVQKLIMRRDHNDKIPIDPATLRATDAMNPVAHMTFERAAAHASILGNEYTVGFVTTHDDPFFLLDIDNCLEPSGNWSPLALEVLSHFPGAYVEVSSGGQGLHIIATGTCPDHSCKNIPLNIELYTEARIINLSGLNHSGDAATDVSAALPAVVATWFPPRATLNSSDWTAGPRESWTGPVDDDVLIKKAIASKSAAALFGNAASFEDLWNVNEPALGMAYPDAEREYDISSADAGLAQHLAFWTGCDCDRMLKIMKRSGLVRDKWTWHKGYLTDTILFAISMQSEVYSVGGAIDDDILNPDGSVIKSGFQIMNVTQQLEHFKGCVYISGLNRALTPRGLLLDQSKFRAVYGGYSFIFDSVGEANTKNAWEALTESQAVVFPKVDSITFRPDLEPGAVFEREGLSMVNSYVPIDVERKQGDPTLFLSHLANVLPDRGDRDIFLAYMAACVQHIGVKFQWCPLLQGCEGNGKTLFTTCVARALGMRYSHFPNAGDLDNKFNGWILNKLFIGVEDIYVPDSRREVLETLKPMITARMLEVQLKGNDQITMDICANFIMNSNHRDAIKKTRNDRRFAVFYTAQQNEPDLARDGMDGDYFKALYNWLNDDGFAVVAEYLHTYEIPDELNPAVLLQRAPTTSTTDQVLAASMGSVESEIVEAISEGRTGFAGSWVSSAALDTLLRDLRAARQIPQNKRRDLMRSLGYDYHPALKGGRCDAIVSIDRGKPRLYCDTSNSIVMGLPADAVIAAYSAAQGNMPSDAGRVFAEKPAEA